mgnify:CR=1 FL=1
MFGDVNFLAVGIAAVLAFALGALWYSAVLFAKPWMAGLGYTEERFKEMQAGMGPTYAISFLSWLVTATVLAAGAAGTLDGRSTSNSVLIWVGTCSLFAVGVGAASHAASQCPPPPPGTPRG